MVVRTVESVAKDHAWIFQNWEKLCKEYPGRVIAVLNGKVHASAESFGHLREIIAKEGNVPSDFAAEFVNANPDSVEKFLTIRDAKVRALLHGDLLS